MQHNVFYKSLANIIHSRLDEHIKNLLGDYQCGFRKLKSTIDQIFILRQILEKYYEFDKEIYVFVNFKQVYDSVLREELWNFLRRVSIPQKYINLLKMCNNYMVCKARLAKEVTQPFKVMSGLRQRDTLSPE